MFKTELFLSVSKPGIHMFYFFIESCMFCKTLSLSHSDNYSNMNNTFSMNPNRTCIHPHHSKLLLSSGLLTPLEHQAFDLFLYEFVSLIFNASHKIRK